jgi:hypothetical protein
MSTYKSRRAAKRVENKKKIKVYIYQDRMGYIRLEKKIKLLASVGSLISVTSGGNHGIYNSNVGEIRKQIKSY